MKIYEILAFNREILARLDQIGIHPNDYKYLDLYKDYLTMKANREKVTYIVAHLAEHYGISERKVYSLLARLGRDCKTHAVPPATDNWSTSK